MTQKKYDIIYADPPWQYNDKMINHGGAETFYSTQSKQWIADLNVIDLSNKACCLFLWVVSPLLDEGIEVLKSWGFKYKTVAFCWSKHTSKGKPVKNLGRWTMGNIELCLLGVKGFPNYWRIDNTVSQLVMAVRTKHSQKPNEVRDRIVNILGNRPRIELFARNKTEGWDVWGNEVESDIEIEVVTPEERIRRELRIVAQENMLLAENAGKLSSSDFEDLLI